MILVGFSVVNHPFLGTSRKNGNPHMGIQKSQNCWENSCRTAEFGGTKNQFPVLPKTDRVQKIILKD
jgi:hypothetical protein